jgi:hypothetical protein
MPPPGVPAPIPDDEFPSDTIPPGAGAEAMDEDYQESVQPTQEFDLPSDGGASFDEEPYDPHAPQGLQDSLEVPAAAPGYNSGTPNTTDEYPAADMGFDERAQPDYVPEDLIESLDEAEEVDDEELIMEPAGPVSGSDDEYQR